MFINWAVFFSVMGQLDIYLKRHLYDWYSRGKTYEIRNPWGRFDPSKVVRGGPVVVHEGSTGRSFRGTVGKVIVDSLDAILAEVPVEKIAPGFSERRLRQAVHELLGEQPEYIAFEIIRG